MLMEFLSAHPLRDMILPGPLSLFPDIDDRPAWDGLSPEIREDILALGDRFAAMEYPLLKASQFMAFFRSGSRVAWEDPYFTRRRKLIAAVLARCVRGPEGPESLDEIVDGLWLICEESSWVLSAHNRDGDVYEGAVLPDPENPVLDLFAGQTAMILSLVSALLGRHLDEVSPLIRRRIHREIELRVLRPFERRNDFWWMGVVRKDINNWTPWIVSNVMLSAALWVEDPLRRADILARGCRMLDRYLDVMPQDGGCDEGAAYWGMAGGALLDCLDVLEKATGGRMAFWTDEKIRGILRYPLAAWVGGRWFVNFADCDAAPDMYGERLSFAGSRIGDPALEAMGACFPGSVSALLSDTPQLWRALNHIFHRPKSAAQPALPPDIYLESLQLRLVRRAGAVLVCKGGTNGDSHNHNDVGSFMLYDGEEPVVVDAGNMVYSRKTFSSERYTLWNTRSMYHNVPLIGGAEQRDGREFAASGVRPLPDGLACDIAGAYPPEAGAEKALRTFRLSGEGVFTLEDQLLLRKAESVTWVFLLRRPPEIRENEVITGAWRIRPSRPLQIQSEEIPVTDRRMARNFPGSLWRVCFTADPAAAHTLLFTLSRT